jgi:hypothetical protein
MPSSPASGWLRPRRIVLALVGLLLLCGLALAVQAWRAADALVDARSLARTLSSQLDKGDLAGARQTADRIASATGRARSSTGGPLWAAASHVPVLGRNAAAVRTSAEVLDVLASDSLPQLLELGQQVDSGDLRPRKGRIDLAAVERLAPSVRRTADRVDEPARRMAAVNPNGLIGPLGDLVKDLRARVADGRAAIDATADAFDVLPRMLGADGPRTYLLLVQNPAELRSTGGLPGSWAVLHARNGKLTMGRQGDANLFRTGRPPIRLTAEEQALFGRDLGADPRDINFTPDFPRVARIAAGLARAHGVTVDGVVAVDPIALSYVLLGTGPVDAGSGVQLNSGNTALLLLNEIYRTIQDPAAQNAFYEDAARRTFDALVAGQGNQLLAIRGLVLAAGQNRVLAWSKDPEVARVIGDNKLSGALPTDTGRTAQVGLYLNDGVAGKMDFYLRQSSDLVATSCDDGVQTLQLTATFRSVAPKSLAKGSVYVTGTGEYVPRGDILMNLRVFGPWQGSIRSLEVDGRPITVTGNRYKDRQVATVPVVLEPGGILTVTGTLRTGPGQTGDIRVTSTPGMELTRNPATYLSACD